MHFLQIIWAETDEVGCGRRELYEGNNSVQYYVCNYSPQANVVGMPIYKIGEPCSECPTDYKCSGVLCGEFFSGLCKL